MAKRGRMTRRELDAHCRTLLVDWPVEIDELRSRHRQAIALLHPDQFPEGPKRQNAEERVKKLNESFEQLRGLLDKGWTKLCDTCGEILIAPSCEACEAEKRAVDSRDRAREEAARLRREVDELKKAKAGGPPPPQRPHDGGSAEAEVAALRAEVERLKRERSQNAPSGGRQDSRPEPPREPPPQEPRREPFHAPPMAYPPPPPIAPMPMPGSFASAGGAEVWRFWGADPYYPFEFTSPAYVGSGTATRQGYMLYLTGTVSVGLMFSQPFHLPLEWDGAFLRGVLNTGVHLVPLALRPYPY